jgi:rare lipoprotein A
MLAPFLFFAPERRAHANYPPEIDHLHRTHGGKPVPVWRFAATGPIGLAIMARSALMPRKGPLTLKGGSVVLIALMALGGAMGTGHAQESADATELTEDASFDDAFDHLDGQLAEPSMTPHVVDMTTIEPPHGPRHLGSGVASYYGRRFNGRPTASGELFDMNAFTAAHRTLPFGSMVRVTNPANGKSVVVRVNDRGPHVKSREIDLSRAAAEEIGLVQRGHGEVELELLD